MQEILTLASLTRGLTAGKRKVRVVLMCFYSKINDLIDASFVQREVAFSSENDGGIVGL